MQQLIAMGGADQLERSIGLVHLLIINTENFRIFLLNQNLAKSFIYL